MALSFAIKSSCTVTGYMSALMSIDKTWFGPEGDVGLAAILVNSVATEILDLDSPSHRAPINGNTIRSPTLLDAGGRRLGFLSLDRAPSSPATQACQVMDWSRVAPALSLAASAHADESLIETSPAI